MNDPHPLAIIPLQKNLLPSDTSSNSSSSVGSSPSSSTPGANANNAPLVPIRALVAHKGGTAAAGLDASIRSEDDAALMRSLISLLPHERADSQFSVTSPVRRTDPPDGSRNESWFRARPGAVFGGGDYGGSSCSTTDSAGASCHKGGEHRGGGGGGSSCSQSVPVPAGRGGRAGPGLDFLGTTDSVRDLLHLPYTSDAVTVGLHRVGETLVLDGNLGEVLAPTADATKASAPAPPPPSRGGVAPTANPGGGAATINMQGSAPPGRSSSMSSNTVVGGGEKEGRWVMVGRGGKPQRDEEGWEHEAEGARVADSGVAAAAFARDQEGTGKAGGGGAERSNGKGRGWEDTGGVGGREQQAQTNVGAGAGWSIQQGSWPTLGASASDMVGSAHPGGGILSIVPSRSRVDSFGVRPPEPAGFWRAVQWELGGMHLMLGSSLPVCSTNEHPQVAVRLHDGDEDLSLCTCLDYYLDNVMENVPELALCMREKGYIQGCRLVSTEDIPYLGSLTRKAAAAQETASKEARPQVVGRDVDKSVPLFDPVVVELNATILLRFLQENCSREGGTYLLHRSEGAAHVQLYDVSALSRQRHRRWKWLLAMLCYRFAVRISHHTRQPWCRGGRPAGPGGQGASSSAASADGPVDTTTAPGPEVVRHLQRRQRQLLENSLELLAELAQLGGGGHETICASVQEHIADTYLGYGSVNGTLMSPGVGDGDGDHAAGRAHRRGGRGAKASTSADFSAAAEPAVAEGKPGLRQPWTVDSEGRVSTSPLPVRPPPAGRGGSTHKKGKRRGGAANGGAVRGKATRGGKPEAGREGGGGGLHPASVRLGDGGGGSDAAAGRAAGDEGGERSTGQQREDYLDKAQDHLTSGIAILRGVMARQESAAAGKDGSAADLVVVGESQLPVAIMRQQQSPWLAVDDEDEEDEDGFTDRGVDHQAGGGGGGGGRGGDALPQGHHQRRDRRRRRGSRDESEDPATAMSVVSEQLWGLQQKLVGTYVAAARARLGRAFPGPSITTSERSFSSSPGGKHSQRSVVGANGGGSGGGSRKGTAGNGGGIPSGLARREDLEDGPDEETCTELVRLSLESLRSAWEHLKDATVTLDRRSAAVFPPKGAEVGEDSTETTTDDDQSVEITEAGGVTRPDGARSKEKVRSTFTPDRGQPGSGQEEPAEGLGSLWKGSLSEALARSGSAAGDGAGHGSVGLDGDAPTLADDAVGTVDAFGGVNTSKLSDADDAMGCLAWNRSARRQLDSRRAELFELCGDVAHACVVLRAGAAGPKTAEDTTVDRGGALAPNTGQTERKGSLLSRLDWLLSAACPPLTLKDLDVCQDLHGHVLEALNGNTGNGKTDHRNTNSTPGGGKKRRSAPLRWTASGARGGGGSPDEVNEVAACAPRTSSPGEVVVANVVPDGKEEDGKLSAANGSSTSDPPAVGTIDPPVAGTSDPPELGDPPPLDGTCVHSLARLGHVPGDAAAWSLCLAAEACYERALVYVARGGAVESNPGIPAAAVVNHRRPGDDRLDKGEYASGGVPEAHARLRKKLGDASNELGKLMAQCAGALAQAPTPTPPSLSPGVGEAAPASTTSTAKNKSRSAPHPGLGCAVCVACAERWFRRSLVDFRAIDDARNTALLLCNLASVERLKSRALTRLKDACPMVKSSLGAVVSGGDGGGRGGRTGGGKEGDLAPARGAAAAVDLCGEAHAVLGRRDADARTWDHASRELAMAYLCLGVERRQELLRKLRGPGPIINGAPEQARAKRDSAVRAPSASVPSAGPSVAQARGVVEPLERALQIYTDMQNAPQAAACHYQIGQYYAKVLPAYVGLGASSPDPSASPSAVGGNSSNSNGNSNSSISSRKSDARSAALQASKAWETGQRAARHYLAARAYFAPFERGPTSIILALDLCDLYLFLADMGNAGGGTVAAGSFAGQSAAPLSGGAGRGAGGMQAAIPIPASSGRGEGVEADGATAGDQVRPTTAVRYQCLEGALRSLLDTRFVFAESDAVAATTRAPGTVGTGTAKVTTPQASTAQATTPGGKRMLVLLGSVTERLPKVMQALLRASVETQSSSFPPRGGVVAAAGTAAGVAGRSSAPAAAGGAAESAPLAAGRCVQGGGGGGKGGGVNSSSNELKGLRGIRVVGSEQAKKKSTAFKSMYRRTLTATRDGGEGAYAMLAGLALDYEATM